jgi:hypothetical protein
MFAIQEALSSIPNTETKSLKWSILCYIYFNRVRILGRAQQVGSSPFCVIPLGTVWWRMDHPRWFCWPCWCWLLAKGPLFSSCGLSTSKFSLHLWSFCGLDSLVFFIRQVLRENAKILDLLWPVLEVPESYFHHILMVQTLHAGTDSVLERLTRVCDLRGA